MEIRGNRNKRGIICSPVMPLQCHCMYGTHDMLLVYSFECQNLTSYLARILIPFKCFSVLTYFYVPILSFCKKMYALLLVVENS